jgi:hypothetical protein
MFLKTIKVLSVFILIGCTNLHSEDFEKKSVMVKKTQVRSSPSFLSKVLYELSYTEQITELLVDNNWSKIKSLKSSDLGWVNSSALSKNSFTLKSSRNIVDLNLSDREVSLAGKGFNSLLEYEFIDKNSIDFTWIDIMESYEIETEDAIAFLLAKDVTTNNEKQ